MLLNYIILLLLYWPCTKGTSVDYVTDQVATASENNAVYSLINATEKTDTNLLSPSTEPNENIVHYENSNGFIPLMTSTQKYQSPNSTSIKRHQKNFSNDIYSSAARLFLKLPGPTINRRSFDLQSDEKQFEILKVNDQTPAVANYHEFYENLKSNMHSNTKSTMELAHNVPYHRTNERMKQIENYLNYDKNQQQSNSNHYSLYNHHGNIQNTQKKTAYEQEKVHNNYHQHGASDYDIFGESVTRQRATSSPLLNYDNIDSTKNNRNKFTLLSKQLQSKPVVVVEPGDYKVNLHHGNHQSTAKSIVSTTNPYHNIRDMPEQRYDKNEDYSDENSDYYEITERPRRLHKSRRKPNYSDSSRKLPKEHRGTSFIDLDELKKVNLQTRSKLHRTRPKLNNWNNENQSQDENESSEGDIDNVRTQESNRNAENAKENSNSWSQIAPNVEFTRSNNYEVSQIDKPNVLVPINLNLVPLSNFDHSTALGNSQGFDFTNAGIPNFVTAGSVVSTAAPLISSNQPILMSTISPHSATENGQNINNGNYGYSTAVPDIIVGQNSYQNTVQALLLPQSMHNKYTPNLKTYYPNNATPMFTINSGIHSTPLSKTNSPHVTAIPQIFYPSPTLQPIIHTSGHPSSNYNIIVNPHGLHGQTIQPMSHHNDHDNNNNNTNNNNNNGNRSASVTDVQSKQSTFTGSNGQFLASASFSVGRGSQSSNAQANNKYYAPTNNVNNNVLAESQNNAQILRPQLQSNDYPRIKTFIPAQVIPAFVQTPSGMAGVNLVNQNQLQQHQLTNVGNNIFGNTWSQLQQLQQSYNQPNGYNNRVQYETVYANRDNAVSTSNNNANMVNAIQNGGITKAQLPVVGVQTVEIQNPNIYIKPNAVGVSSINQYPGAVLTTPIPIFSTAQTLLFPRPAITSTSPQSMSIQSYVDSLTQIGAQNNLGNRLEQKLVDQNQLADHSKYNPMNFVPSIEVVKSQTLLNGKTSEQALPPLLNLVPVVPGGKFYKHSHAAQADLMSKPKLSSDLEKYAEEMFKESIRTIYNTHQWNIDKQIRNYTTANDGIDFERLKSDLERYKAAMVGSKYGKDILEGHHSEPQIHTTDPGRVKKPGLSTATIEELFKNDFKIKSLSNSHSSSNGKPDSPQVIKLNDYLTPPRLHSFVSKSPFTDANKQTKKRPSKTRHHSRPSNSHGPRPTHLESSASNHVIYSHRRPHYNRNVHNDYRKSKNYDQYPTFTTSTPDINVSQTSKSDHYDINHPRMHNYLGLLMKNTQLPAGSSTSVVANDDNYKQYFDNDRRQMQMNTDESLQSLFSSYIR